ncbi:TadE/TadG family type IV pilus assembly protein [Curvivirga aplysinae]|uniref:TadE/TadG family type IV pilus assembly protein n=1 Tax=Curvivirga aplysinae TaxID=2529852 RepID=UPI0012BC44D4|nr:TadE/TadG family type IV pilus assembly protein [Curvivirga aplysinae]MTI08238.1 pilus assembly protein [Curvivirga aplysinae]
MKKFKLNNFSKFPKCLDFIKNETGLAAVEMAIALPIMVSLLLSGVEITRYVLLNQKLERASTTIADLAAREETISEDVIADIFEITDEVMRPFEIDLNTTVILSSIIKTGNDAPEVVWQRSYGSSSTTPSGSRYGTAGETANLPDNFIMRSGEGIITAEVAHDFEATFLSELVPNTVLYKNAIYRPRYGAQYTVTDN